MKVGLLWLIVHDAGWLAAAGLWWEALVVGGLLYNARTPVIESSGEMLAAGYQKEQIIAEWSQPLADDAALGLMLADLEAREGEVW